jgi:hypothetical protein
MAVELLTLDPVVDPVLEPEPELLPLPELDPLPESTVVEPVDPPSFPLGASLTGAAFAPAV